MNPDQETAFEHLEAIDINASIPQIGTQSTYKSEMISSSDLNSEVRGLNQLDPSDALTIDNFAPIAGLYAENWSHETFLFS